MRIIAGLYRGRKIRTLSGLQLRPTPDRLRQSLFDVLGSSIEGSIFIDAYAGSGAVGIEAISRGARQAFLVEENPAACRVIQENLASLDIGSQAEVLRSNAITGLRALEQRGIRTDFCFLDPPYESRSEYTRALRRVGKGGLIQPTGWVIVQHSKREQLEDEVERLKRVRILTQGSNAISFYRETGWTGQG